MYGNGNEFRHYLSRRGQMVTASASYSMILKSAGSGRLWVRSPPLVYFFFSLQREEDAFIFRACRDHHACNEGSRLLNYAWNTMNVRQVFWSDANDAT